ncbi:MAG: peptide chain release factor N(5)-glutamine methyltransferase [Desulfovermiculus sp.]
MPLFGPSIADCIRQSEMHLHHAGVDSPRLSAELLLSSVLQTDRLWVLTHLDAALSPGQVDAYADLVGRRARGQPLAYLLGRKEFFGIDLHVTPAVLIPRPDTEVLIEICQNLWADSAELRFVDAGTGSGAIGIAMALQFPKSHGLLTDMSMAALGVAQKNINHYALDRRLDCICCDLLSICRKESLQAVLSNPPYISTTAYWALSPEIRNFEPPQALWSGMYGMEMHVRLIEQAQWALQKGGWLCMEIGDAQSEPLLYMLRSRYSGNWSEMHIVPDWSARDRALLAKRV